MAICLFLFGAWKTVAMDNGGLEGKGTEELTTGTWRDMGGRRERVKQAVKGGVEMLMVGGVAAGGAMCIVRFFEGVGG